MRCPAWLVWALLATGSGTTGCGSPRVVSVLGAVPQPPGATGPALAIVVDATAVRLPLAVSGASVAYADVDRALERSIRASTAKIEERLASSGRRDELFVELVDARAEYTGSRLVVSLSTRDTLRARAGNAYIAQTHARASSASAVPPERGAPVLIEAADSIGSQLAGFLLGLDLH